MRKYGPWVIHCSNKVYHDPWLDVRVDQVTRPDGHPGTYSTVRLKSGVCVIAIDEQQQVHLTREFHYAVGRYTIEGISGGIEAGEDAEATAHRELGEELGLTARHWRRLGQVDPFTGSIHSQVDLFLAEGLGECETSPDGTEQIEHVCIPLSAALEMVRTGEISHSPTCVALLRIALDRLVG